VHSVVDEHRRERKNIRRVLSCLFGETTAQQMSTKLFWWRLGCLSAASAVGLGAFGAHGLRNRIADPRLLKYWETAVTYHFIHSWGLIFVALSPRFPKYAGYAFLGGTLLFSGSLYALALTDKRWLGSITPFGGLLFIVGWGLLALTGF
jgi:uncharacterized membrane protein YgdD (TMEM256/DUF423 family)